MDFQINSLSSLGFTLLVCASNITHCISAICELVCIYIYGFATSKSSPRCDGSESGFAEIKQTNVWNNIHIQACSHSEKDILLDEWLLYSTLVNMFYVNNGIACTSQGMCISDVKIILIYSVPSIQQLYVSWLRNVIVIESPQVVLYVNKKQSIIKCLCRCLYIIETVIHLPHFLYTVHNVLQHSQWKWK